MEQWDPIGVKNAPEAGDEYDGYIGSIFDLINRNATVLEIEEYLRGPNNATWNWDFLKTGRCCA
jgi:hypothetical protein